ncbi:glucan endo-1,3-beta-glucosidase [Folsomia candida]|uniref:glucan endo-1,3-beta-glucosidase n=1 Tax=Folsomia candida TaxID=158441 RepID=UPI000B905ABD|nr:glucan endo-1,3-beta-glucosidase [Folsomia candida]
MSVVRIIFSILAVIVAGAHCRQITFNNRCGRDIWISPLTNGNGAPLPDGIRRLSNSGSYTYQIPNGGWGGRFWPKTGCDGSGQNCEVGQSMPPCPAGGCQPPAETKVEFFFPRTGAADSVWYDVSLVDGYSLPAEIVPSRQGGSCVTTHCSMSLDACPSGENHVGDLRVWKGGRVAMCLAPCKKWNYPSPYGLGKSENIEPGQHLCCPTPPVSPESCRNGIVVQTQYVNLIHKTCPSAYSYAYDDEAGLHNCPNDVSFTVTFCP